MPRVIEIGTKRWGNSEGGHRSQILKANPAGTWLGVDAEAGEDVDVVADAHYLSERFGQEFDAAVLHSTLEHFRRPWQAVAELAKVVKPGGWVSCQTHQTFPLHNYPQDFFRFSIEAIAELFAPDVGWKLIECEYTWPCKIIPLTNIFAHAKDWDFTAPAWLGVSCIAERV
jgi:SAM-dependent methyltransferase